MFYIPAWISNVLLLVTCYLSGFQFVQLKRANPVMNIQFMMIVFCMILIVIVALYNKENPWLSLVFFLIAVCNLSIMVRQHRMLPPMRKFE